MIIDTHTHLYLNDFAADIDDVIKKAADEGVEKFYLPAIDSTETDNLLALEKKYPGKCFAMMGLHPCSVKENYKEEENIKEENKLEKLKRENRELRDVIDKQRESLVDIVGVK